MRGTGFAVSTLVPPYSRSKMRAKGGIKRTAFYPIISQFATEYKLYNHYLKPQQITDPVEEYWAMRNVAGLWDVTGEEIVEVTGPGALEAMNELVPRDLSKLKDGRALYCVMCYEYGGIIEDGILVRFGPDRLWWIGGEAHSEQWIFGKTLGRGVTVKSHLDRIHVASIQGPKSREILQRVCDTDLSRVPYYGAVPEATVCGVPVSLTRTGFTAELGFDIYVAVPDGEALFRALWEAGRPDGLQLCGSRSMNIRRIEASILNAGQDFDWTMTPYEVNLGWAVDLSKPSFCGKEALARIHREKPSRCVVGLRIDGETVPEEGSCVFSAGEHVGEVTSATFSPALRVGLAMAFVRADASELGTVVAIEGCDGQVRAEVVSMPFVDPERRLAKA